MVRSRRQAEFDSDANSPNPLVHLFQKFKDKSISTEKLFQQICDLKIELVLTAHPTEVSRRTLIQKYDDINACLSQLDQQKLTPRERQNALANLKQQISSAWQTDEIRSIALLQSMKQNGVLPQLSKTLWNAVPKFIRELNELVQENCQLNLPLNIAPVRFASWMAETVMATQMLPIKLPKKCCGYHAGKLPISI